MQRAKIQELRCLALIKWQNGEGIRRAPPQAVLSADNGTLAFLFGVRVRVYTAVRILFLLHTCFHPILHFCPTPPALPVAAQVSQHGHMVSTPPPSPLYGVRHVLPSHHSMHTRVK